MDKAWWIDEQESGPPTIEDDAWYQHHVVSRGYPKVKREPKQLPGQQSIEDIHNCVWEVLYEDEHMRTWECVCGARVTEGG